MEQGVASEPSQASSRCALCFMDSIVVLTLWVVPISLLLVMETETGIDLC